ncbi:putative clathrin assembly protein [Tanacetum coccineum]
MGRFSKAIAAVKDQTSIRLARSGSRTSLSDLDVAIVKATSHDECPSDESHILAILNLTSDSPIYVASCVNTISQRLNKTRNWVVALKTLMLVRRLLRDGNPLYEHEIFFATRRGTRLLNMSDFRDTLKSNTWDYAAFVRAFALFLDEQLEYKMQGRRETASSSSHELLERFLACRPAGEARCNRMVMVALYPLLVQSFQIYQDLKEVMGVLTNRFDELNVPLSVKVYGIFRRVSTQYEELQMFYDWCKSVGIARTSEYPEIDKISQTKLDSMDERIKEKSNA